MNLRNKVPMIEDDWSGCDDFDELLEQSSVGTRAAKENQAQTPPEAYERLEEHLRTGKLDRRCDVDDFLLNMVRWYSAARDAEDAGALVVILQRGLQWSFQSTCHSVDVVHCLFVEAKAGPLILRWSEAVPKIVRTLHERDVFSYLRQDVARGMVDICFTSHRPLPLVITNACAAALTASHVRDDLAGYFSTLLQPLPPLSDGAITHFTVIEPDSATESSPSLPPSTQPARARPFGLPAGLVGPVNRPVKRLPAAPSEPAFSEQSRVQDAQPVSTGRKVVDFLESGALAARRLATSSVVLVGAPLLMILAALMARFM